MGSDTEWVHQASDPPDRYHRSLMAWNVMHCSVDAEEARTFLSMLGLLIDEAKDGHEASTGGYNDEAQEYAGSLVVPRS